MLYNNLLNILNIAFSEFFLSPPPCIIEYGANAGQFDSTCLEALAAAFCGSMLGQGNSLNASRLATYFYIKELVICGPQPAYPDGLCSDQSFNASSSALAASIANASKCILPPRSDSASSSASGASSSIGLAAGAAGAVVAIVIVAAVIVVRRRNKIEDQKRQKVANAKKVKFCAINHFASLIESSFIIQQ